MSGAYQCEDDVRGPDAKGVSIGNLGEPHTKSEAGEGHGRVLRTTLWRHEEKRQRCAAYERRKRWAQTWTSFGSRRDEGEWLRRSATKRNRTLPSVRRGLPTFASTSAMLLCLAQCSTMAPLDDPAAMPQRALHTCEAEKEEKAQPTTIQAECEHTIQYGNEVPPARPQSAIPPGRCGFSSGCRTACTLCPGLNDVPRRGRCRGGSGAGRGARASRA